MCLYNYLFFIYIDRERESKYLRVTTWTPPQQQLKPPRVLTNPFSEPAIYVVESFQVGHIHPCLTL